MWSYVTRHVSSHPTTNFKFDVTWSLPSSISSMADSTAIKRSQSGGSSQYEEHSSNDEGATTGQNPLLGVKRRKKRGEGSYAAGFGRKTDSASWARVRSSPMAVSRAFCSYEQRSIICTVRWQRRMALYHCPFGNAVFPGEIANDCMQQAISAPAPAPAPAPASTPQAPLIGSSSSQNRALAPIAHNTSTQPPALRFLPRPPVPRPQAQAQSKC